RTVAAAFFTADFISSAARSAYSSNSSITATESWLIEIFFPILPPHFLTGQLDTFAPVIHVIHSGDIVKFPIELHPEMGTVYFSRLFAPADRKINAGVIHHHPCVSLFFPGLAADGRITGIERLPFIPPVPDGIGDHRIL